MTPHKRRFAMDVIEWVAEMPEVEASKPFLLGLIRRMEETRNLEPPDRIDPPDTPCTTGEAWGELTSLPGWKRMGKR